MKAKIKEKNFCILCSKMKEEPLSLAILGVIEETKTPIQVSVCNLCQIVLHNIRRICNDVKIKSIKNTETIHQLIEEKKKEAIDVKNS